MSMEWTYYCEGPDCGDKHDGGTPCHVKTASAPPHLPNSFIETRGRSEGVDHLHHFCSWDCLMKYAAREPVPEIIPWDDALGMGGE